MVYGDVLGDGVFGPSATSLGLTQPGGACCGHGDGTACWNECCRTQKGLALATQPPPPPPQPCQEAALKETNDQLGHCMANQRELQDYIEKLSEKLLIASKALLASEARVAEVEAELAREEQQAAAVTPNPLPEQQAAAVTPTPTPTAAPLPSSTEPLVPLPSVTPSCAACVLAFEEAGWCLVWLSRSAVVPQQVPAGCSSCSKAAYDHCSSTPTPTPTSAGATPTPAVMEPTAMPLAPDAPPLATATPMPTPLLQPSPSPSPTAPSPADSQPVDVLDG